jgi:hypothetical protein
MSLIKTKLYNSILASKIVIDVANIEISRMEILTQLSCTRTSIIRLLYYHHKDVMSLENL